MFRAWWHEEGKHLPSLRVLRECEEDRESYQWKRVLHRSLFIVSAQWSEVRPGRDVIMDLLNEASTLNWSIPVGFDVFGVPEGVWRYPHSGRFGVCALWHAVLSNDLWLLKLLLQWRSVDGDYVDPTTFQNYALWAAASRADVNGSDALDMLVEWRGPNGEAGAVDTKTWFVGSLPKVAEGLCARTVRWSALRETWVAAVATLKLCTQ